MSLELLNNPFLGNFKEWEKGHTFPNHQGVKNQNTENIKNISNDYALKSPFKKDSIFFSPNIKDFDDLTKIFYVGGINYELLSEHLKNKLGRIEGFVFDFKNYKLEDTTIYSGISTPGIPLYNILKTDKPFNYKNNNKEIQAKFEISKLNERKNLLSNSYNFRIYYDKNKIIYCIIFIYKDGEDEKFQDLETIVSESPTDFKLNDEYVAIKLFTTNVETFIGFIRLIKGDSDAESLKNKVIQYYNYFFADAKEDPNKLDGLYENIPDFVLEQKTDDELWKDLVLLSDANINQIGTNENLSVIKLLKGFKNASWWYNMINQNPEIIRKLFKNFSSKYIEELVKIFSIIGLRNWTIKELEQAWKFDLDYENFEPFVGFNGPYVKYTGFSYYNTEKKKYKIGTAIFAYMDKTSVMPYNETEIGPNVLQLPFMPMKMITENGAIYIPCFVTEYFTNKKIDEEWWTVINNIAVGLLPEIDANSIRGLANIARISSGKKIKTVEELIEFLEKVDQNVMAEDLEKVGIEALFRGTTRYTDGELFIGNLSSIENGASTSTDPIRAIIFGIESSSKPGTKGVLQIYVPKDLKGLNLQAPNVRVSKELEVIVNTSPENLFNFVVKEVPIEDARKLANEIYGLDIPKTITENSIPSSNMLLDDMTKLTLKESEEFYKKIIKLKK